MYSVVIEHFLYIHYTQERLFVKLQKCYKTGSNGPMAVFQAIWLFGKGLTISCYWLKIGLSPVELLPFGPVLVFLVG
ncbi:hypothetical protein [Urinicoccus timonensis]|uniref:hypothetical protein n=1 Tax=Urinicoccus timonensis TaxID=2024205 RepID=UPI000C07A3E4|nr:hypothetical protein [Urinicoccus timonensis]